MRPTLRWLLPVVLLCLDSVPCWSQSSPAAAFPGLTWQEKTPEEMGVSRAKLDALKHTLSIPKPDRSAGCVVKDGYFIYAWGAFDQRHNWASASKPVLSTMLFAAMAEDRVKGPESVIHRYWPGLRSIDQTMTFRHLADMMSGYACGDKDKDAKPLPPGSRWAYNDYAIMLYARTLDKVFGGDGGMPSGALTALVRAAQERFAIPLQFQDTELLEKGRGRVVASPRDFARLGWLWRNKGNWNGKQLLPREFFAEYVEPDVPLNTPRTQTQLKPPFDDYLGVGSYGGGINQGDGQGIYGFNWWFNKSLTVRPRNLPVLAWPSAPPETFLALGRGGKDGLIILPSLGLVVAAYNDASPTWGDALITEPPDPKGIMNQNLRLLVEGAAKPPAGR